MVSDLILANLWSNVELLHCQEQITLINEVELVFDLSSSDWQSLTWIQNLYLQELVPMLVAAL